MLAWNLDAHVMGRYCQFRSKSYSDQICRRLRVFDAELCVLSVSINRDGLEAYQRSCGRYYWRQDMYLRFVLLSVTRYYIYIDNLDRILSRSIYGTKVGPSYSVLSLIV